MAGFTCSADVRNGQLLQGSAHCTEPARCEARLSQLLWPLQGVST